MLDCKTFKHDQYFCVHFTTYSKFTAAAHCTCGLCGLTMWCFDIKMCVYMYPIDLLNDNYTQHGLTAIIKIPKLNLKQANHSLGIFCSFSFTNCDNWTFQYIQVSNI